MLGRGSTQPNMAAERSLGHHSQSQGLVISVDSEHGNADEPSQETGTGKRARWSHEMKMFLIRLLKDHDVPGFRTRNAWSKEAWTNIVCRLNNKFGTLFTLNQVKQKDQDLKKDYRTVKDLLDESGFGWDSQRKNGDSTNTCLGDFLCSQEQLCFELARQDVPIF